MSLYEQAQKLVHNDKRKSYGPMYESFNKIAAIWSGILNIPIDAKQVALCMLGMKLSRESNKHQEDNIVDLYGYCICLEGIIKEENVSVGQPVVNNTPNWAEEILLKTVKENLNVTTDVSEV